VKLNEVDSQTPPLRVVRVEPNAFVDNWSGKPSDAVAVGLRLLSEREKFGILKESKTKAREAHPDDARLQYETESDTAMRLLVAAALCDVNDVSKPSSLFRFPQNEVFSALTESGARYLFDEVLKLQVETSVAHTEASEDDLAELFELISEGAIDSLDGERRSSVLRHLRFALDLISEVVSTQH
jgi:hypothetical protein